MTRDYSIYSRERLIEWLKTKDVYLDAIRKEWNSLNDEVFRLRKIVSSQNTEIHGLVDRLIDARARIE